MCKKNNPLISVIVPVYKVEKYLERCIDSIIKQEYTELEIILVDDGSPDACGKICDNYADVDDRIVVIHKENGGLSDARNVALRICTGNYVTCVDSDDWISKFYIINLYNAIKKDDSDLAISGFENVYEGKTYVANEVKSLEEYELLNAEQCFQKLLYQDGVETSAWGKLYKRKLLFGLQYPVGKLYEDIPVTTEAIHRSNKIALIKNADYYYFQRHDSIQYDRFDHRKMDAYVHILNMQKFITIEYPSLEKASKCRTFCTACNLIFSIDDIKKYHTDFDKLWRVIRTSRLEIILDRKARYKARIAAIISYGGFHFFRYIYGKTQMRGKKYEDFTGGR